jgi:hypothetical protein
MHVHDPLFALPKHPPFEAGEGPFRVKGAAVADELTFYRSLLSPGGSIPKAKDEPLLPALRLLPNERFAKYLELPHSRTAWYDLAPLVYLTSCVAQIRGIPLTQQLKANAEWHAAQAARGISGLVLQIVSAQTLATWLPRVAGFFHDFGEVVTERTGTNRVVATRTGVPQFFVRTWATIGTEFVETTLARAGTRARVYALPVVEAGKRFGHPVYTVPFEISWE